MRPEAREGGVERSKREGEKGREKVIGKANERLTSAPTPCRTRRAASISPLPWHTFRNREPQHITALGNGVKSQPLLLKPSRCTSYACDDAHYSNPWKLPQARRLSIP